jgi:hypothetical protein
MSKNILIFMPNFFNTEEEIKNALIANGYSVDIFADRPNEKTLTRAIIRKNRKLAFYKTTRYVNQVINEIGTKEYDAIVFINGQSFCVSHIRRLLKEIKYKKSVFYMWDRLGFLPYTKKLLPLFDETATFDIKDYEKGLFKHFLPLYIPEEYSFVSPSETKKYDGVFVGTGKTAKVKALKKIKREFEKEGLTLYSYLYCPAKAVFLSNKIFHPLIFCGLKKKNFNFAKLSTDAIKNLYSQSKSVVDPGAEDEGGLSLRIGESLGFKNKIITSNQSIRQYSFYNENNIYVFPNEKYDISAFLDRKFDESNLTDLAEYHINQWVKHLINPAEIDNLHFLKRNE